MFQGLEIWGKNFCDFQILRRDVWEPWTTDSSISSQLLKSRNTITADTYEPKLHVMKHLHESHHHSVDECNIGQLLPVLSPSNASCVSNATKNTLMFNHTARVTGSTEVMLNCLFWQSWTAPPRVHRVHVPIIPFLVGVQVQGDHSRQCEIPWQFHDISLMVRGTPAHVKCYSYHTGTSVIVSGGVRMQQCMIQNQNEMHKLSIVKNGRKYAANNEQF